MQFVKNGPDVPEPLLQAHEDGRVVLFCGAGISRPAGLPDFAGLVDKLYRNLGANPNPEQQAAIKAKRFDTAMGLLENRLVGGREAVRRELANILTPNLDPPGATATHKALLTLSRNRKDRMRMVTTNFDRIFEEVIDKEQVDAERFQAPLLPVPKNRWDGLVYLHGLLSANPSAQDLDRLVISSGDFGLAYLTERWAARFVSELFSNYMVCFVGYSIDDPVLRYMTDALAADRLLGESPLEMFAFGSYSKGKDAERAGEWKAKNVTPILYREYRRHWYLHETLRRWAGAYRDGVIGKEHIVTKYASARPMASAGQDNFVGRVLWALSDPSGLPARRFADHDPVPSLDWLAPLSDKRYRHTDLPRFGVPPLAKEDRELNFSLLHRPAPYMRASWMSLVSHGEVGGGWDDVMRHIARWLLRHLDDPKLVRWLAGQGGRLHHEFAAIIEWRLKELDNSDTATLQRIRDNAPRAIPRPAMRTLWRLLLAGQMKGSSPTQYIDDWRARFMRDGLTFALRVELRDLLAPRISLRPSVHWDEDEEDSGEPETIRDLVDCDLALSAYGVFSELQAIRMSPRWAAALPDLLEDISALLRDAMDLMREVGKADDKHDSSHILRPSIENHSQNTDFPEWTALIELARDAWLATAKVEPARARFVAETWRLTRYPLFRRLAFFAATHDDVISPRQGLDWLLTDDHWWLWSSEIRREATRLLVALARSLETKDLTALERAVLAGPPLAMYSEDIDWNNVVEGEIWWRLATMSETGRTLGADAKAKLDELTSRHPDWRLRTDDRDEFPFWTSDTNEPRRVTATPRRHRDLVEWLKRHPDSDVLLDDDWSQRCQDDFSTTASALRTLAHDGIWPATRWRDALHAWSEEELSWRDMARLLADAPDDALRPIAPDVGRWLRSLAGTVSLDEALFLDLCQRVLNLHYGEDADEGDDGPVTRSLNHPVGQATEALLLWWSQISPKDGEGLPNKIEPVFTGICDARIRKFRHGRVFMAAHVIKLFRVDREWVKQHLLPLFDWRRCEADALAAWRGFFWSPVLYRPLLELVKDFFLDTANHYEALDRDGRQYAALLTFAALDPGDTFTKSELAAATAALPEEGLQHTASALAGALDSSGDRRPEYWRNRVRPYLRRIWPKSTDRRTPGISQGLGKVCISAGEAFPDALERLRHWLQPSQYPGPLTYPLRESGLCCKFPKDALAFLHLVAGDGRNWATELAECLRDIQKEMPELKDDPRFRDLRERIRQEGVNLE